MTVLLSRKDIQIARDGDELTLSVANIKRVLCFENGAPRTKSILFDGRELTGENRESQDFNFVSLSAANAERPYQVYAIRANWLEGTFLCGEHAEVTIEMANTFCDTEYRRTYYLFPGIPAIGVATEIRSEVLPNMYCTYRGRLDECGDARKKGSCQDTIALEAAPAEVKAIEFFGRTDYDDTRVAEHAGDVLMNGNILVASSEDGSGIMFLQEAMPSVERRDWEKHDFRMDGTQIYSCSWGIMPQEVLSDKFLASTRSVLLAYKSEKEAWRCLKSYLKARFPLDREKSGAIVVNPWGCGRFPSLVCEDFLKAEMAAAPSVGANYYQIDDSWQAGKALSEISSKNKHISPAFWDISDSLHNTFEPIMEVARKAGIKPGLWLAPSNNCNYNDWQDMVKIIISMYNNYGIDLFKIDNVIVRSYEAQDNLEKLLRTVREKTGGKVMFNLDTTNGQRPGYFLFLEYGNIFLENRYVCHLWGCGYHPEKTLRSLWTLSKYMRAQALQIEVPSPDDINPQFYADKAWSNLADYSTEYWTAISMFASPLMWFAPSLVSPEQRERIKSVNTVHSAIWNELFECEVYPIGNEPDGTAITGFQAYDSRTQKGFILIFREIASTCGSAEIELEYPVGSCVRMECAGSAKDAVLTPLANGKIRVELPQNASFTLWKID